MRLRVLAVLTLVLIESSVFAADVYYDIPLGDLKLDEGSKWPVGNPRENLWGQTMRVSVAAPAEAYVSPAWRGTGNITRLSVRAPQGQKITGILVPSPVWYSADPANVPAAVAVHFTLDGTATSDDTARTAFYRAKEACYSDLQRQARPGAAWFRYQANLAREQLGEKDQPTIQPWQRMGRNDDLYDLFSGGRAVAENLQLDRALQVRGDAKDDVKVDTIPGITLKEMDFAALVQGTQVKTDPLARCIPLDQYALFFPDFPAVLDLMDRVDKNTVPVVQNMLPQSSDAGILKRYQTQLGLHASNLARLLGPQLVKSVAVTGSDPSFVMGTDIAILFESPNAATQALLVAQIAQNTRTVKGVRADNKDIEGIGAVQGFLTDDRTVSSYIASMDDTVIVTNSLVQIRRLVSLKSGKLKPLADAPEYRFFRSRYEIGKGEETAFLVISDATIRKWCSARWRIADARRIQDLARENDRIARHTDLMLAGQPLPAGPTSMNQQVQGGDIQKMANAAIVLPTIYKPNGFQKPVVEMDLDTVTKAEADAYSQWRDGYQRNWSGVFDPIGLRISLRPQQMGADLTIMPLIGSTEYRQFINLTQGATLSAGDGDPHSALWRLVFAINRESQTARNWSNLGKTMLPGVKIDPLGWLGHSVALYADDDPYWKEMAAARNTERFMQQNLARLPIALRAECNSPLKLAAFVSAIRAMIEQSAPGLTTWEPQEYHGKTYVKITSRHDNDNGMPELSIFYAALPDSLTVTLNENLIQRALDRAAAATQPATAAAEPKPTTRPWLGKNLAVQVRSGSMDLFSRLAHDQFGRRLQQDSWNNLPILNEWKRLYPEMDPVAVHEQVWGVRLLCPAGGQYVWNKDLQTMESTVVGCPESPKPAPDSLLQFRGISLANFGLTFENDGLRAQVELDTAAAK